MTEEEVSGSFYFDCLTEEEQMVYRELLQGVNGMEETIRLLREKAPGCRVMVGGAVLNQEYADMIGADFYGKDAMQSVHYAQSVFADSGPQD